MASKRRPAAIYVKTKVEERRVSKKGREKLERNVILLIAAGEKPGLPAE